MHTSVAGGGMIPRNHPLTGRARLDALFWNEKKRWAMTDERNQANRMEQQSRSRNRRP